MKVIVYGDFNSLYCYLASQRADRLVREGKADVEWCAVEHWPRLPVTGAKPPPGSVGAQDDLAEAAQLALPGEQPPASSCPGDSVSPAGQPGPHLAGQDSRSACKVRHARVAT